MDIKEFLQEPEIQDLLAAEDLDEIYTKLDPDYAKDLTRFFLEK